MGRTKISEDASTVTYEITDDKGKVVCISTEPKPDSELAALDAAVATVQKQLDPNQADPSTKDVLDAVALLTLNR